MGASQDSVLKKPIIVIGAPRSGTTILGECFAAHRDLEYIEEPRLTWRYGNDDKSDRLLPADARPEVIQHIRSSFAKRILDKGKTRLLEKTPSNSLRLGFVDRVFPDCKFVHIRRNSVDSALSIRRFWLDHAKGLKPNKISERLRELNASCFYYGKEFLRRILPGASFPCGCPGLGAENPRHLLFDAGSRPAGSLLPAVAHVRRKCRLLRSTIAAEPVFRMSPRRPFAGYVDGNHGVLRTPGG
ncbi:MAG: sulfotransferase [Planctomycetota bacterium]